MNLNSKISQKSGGVLIKLFLNFPEVPKIMYMAVFSFSFSKFVNKAVQRHKSWIQQGTLPWECSTTTVEGYFSKLIQIQTDLIST